MQNNERKIILDLAVTLDGFIEGKNGETDWCIMDPDMEFTSFLNDIDTILYGRKSYELWGHFTPETNEEEEKQFWALVHSKEKYVFSKLKKQDDSKVIFIRENIAEEIDALKKKPGKNIWLYGGASLITTFIHLGLVDEFRLSIHPVVLGEGKPLFTNITDRLYLKLVSTRAFSSGVVQLVYRCH
ncbi:dihydrofolate reductase family protein [Metasolibacillus meyeri]|uniref:Dihydrofolate reductase family protein n=1 Tax=Metasolibacillus meyeri TaxID=1071052 RepID=A0AAW9NRP9_9BACL|nr:dihydrofolate reductase family protein [Metasolibacillus meyeri]MEC1177466.1 dihydrofolate reductase family protein [Metasolibacillus meyeri]